MIVNVGDNCNSMTVVETANIHDVTVVETEDVYDVTVSCDNYNVTASSDNYSVIINTYQTAPTEVTGFDFSSVDNSGYAALIGGI